MDFEQISKEVEISAIRGGGPGGQNVNKVSSCAFLTWDFLVSQGLNSQEKSRVQEKLKNFINSELQLTLRCEVHRSLERNKSQCLSKLKDLLQKALHRPKPRKATRPTMASRKKRKAEKIRRGEIKKLRKKPVDI